LQRPRTRTDEILEELLNNPEPERPLRGHEILRMAYAGCIPPGEYRYESPLVDGRKEIETFEVNEEGKIMNLKIWVEGSESAGLKFKKSKAGTKSASSAKK